jgi:hypothetical protein
MEVVRSTKMLVNFYQIMHHRITEDSTLHSSGFAAVVALVKTV